MSDLARTGLQEVKHDLYLLRDALKGTELEAMVIASLRVCNHYLWESELKESK
jgi:hypothetical protein